jgi:hypothetical protein
MDLSYVLCLSNLDTVLLPGSLRIRVSFVDVIGAIYTTLYVHIFHIDFNFDGKYITAYNISAILRTPYLGGSIVCIALEQILIVLFFHKFLQTRQK